MERRSHLGLAVSILLAFGVAAVGRLVTDPNVNTWYAELAKPSWTPPSGVFGPVWTALYLMMAIAAWRIWMLGTGPARKRALTLYGLQLAVNGLWSPVFFGWHLLGWALVVIVVLVVLVALTTVQFFRIDRPAGWLLVPYLLWVTFATALNYGIWRLAT